MSGRIIPLPERNKLIDSIINDHPLLARDRTLLVRFMEAKGWVDDALQVLDYLNLVRPGGLLARLQSLLSSLSFPGLSEIAFIIETLTRIGEANLYAVQMLGRKAYAYGVTSWVFEQPMPPLPAADAAKLRQWSSERRVKLGEAEWRRMGDAARTAMLRRCAQEGIHSADYKLLVRLTFSNDPRSLAEAVYRGFEAGMTAFEKDAQRSLRCNYPN